MEALRRHAWPGNIRELRNVIERAVILSRGGRARLDLAMPVQDAMQLPGQDPAMQPADFLTEADFREREKANLIAALRHAGWRILGDGGAADLIGLKPSTLTYRMKIFGIQKERGRGQDG